MTLLADIIQINQQQTDAAIDFNRDFKRANLISGFSPTKSTINVFEHLNAAVQRNAKQQQRAINLHGSYGSGKSHLAVVLGQLLQHGCDGAGFDELFKRIEYFASPQLAQNLKNTFLASTDKDARPYLVVFLNGSPAASIPDALMENLCDALKRHPTLNLENILPKTEYEVCVSCFNDMILHAPELATADLPTHLTHDFLTTCEMIVGLERHNSLALKTFKAWYSHVVYGQTFNPASHGSKNFIEAYVEAGKNLATQHHFGGIVVIWDEFGFALEDLLANPTRSSQHEIKALESFVQTTCSPDLGHTVFIGLTHISFTEYAERAGATESEKGLLEQITGRFTTYKVELNAAESEGYHLLGIQRAWTETGKQLLENQPNAKQHILELCQHLALFNQLGDHLNDVLLDVYPLHPITAAGLFALSGLAAQNNRTALTFFRDNASEFLQHEINSAGLFHNELIRLPALVDYFEKSLKKLAAWERYHQAIGSIQNTLSPDEIASKKAILKLCLLAQLLGEQFQTTEHFLAITLYDSDYSAQLSDDLAYLKGAELVWKNAVTEQWTLSGDSGIDVEGEIEKARKNFTGHSPRQLFETHIAMQEDLLPQLGEHDLEPSDAGIVRSYRVDLLFLPLTNPLKIDNPLLSAHIYLVFAKNDDEVEAVKAKIQETPVTNLYFWLPRSGIRAESVTIEGRHVGLSELLGRYLAIDYLQKQAGISEDFRRQLTAKGEKNRQQLLSILKTLFGREGLQNGKSQIFKAGNADALDCQSWHDLRHHLSDVVAQTYPHEISIRAMNMNRLAHEKYTGSQIVKDIVERVLHFDDNPTYQTDLLGENESSQAAALIDGILGANHLFEHRANGWNIKKIDETTGNVHAILKLIHDALLSKRNRDNPYFLSKLRAELIAPPYGIPGCNLAILAAVAIRHETKGLRWSGKETDFAQNLTDAFKADSKLSLRLFEFSPKQVDVLNAVGDYFSLIPDFNQTREEFAQQCCFQLRDFVKGQSEAVKHSRQLHEKAQKLVKFFDLPFKTQQDTAEFLIELVGTEFGLLNVILDDFTKVEDAKRFEIEQSWRQFLIACESNKADLILRLTHEHATLTAKKLGELLNHAQNSIDDLTHALLNKPFEMCNDMDIGKFQMCLETHIDYHPPRPPQAPILPPSIISPVSKTPSLIDTLHHQIEALHLPRHEIRQALEQLLNDYRD